MSDDREEIIRLNIERFEQLLSAEIDPERRRLLKCLLSEVKAELEFLTDFNTCRVEQAAGTISDARILWLRRKADERRSMASTFDNPSTHEIFLILAERYDRLASNIETDLPLQTRDHTITGGSG